MLNEHQLEAVKATDGAVLVVSGPGSGKTRVLTSRVAYMIEKGVSPSSILAITFTNRAAAEMRERVTSLVGQQVAEKVWMGTFHSMCVRILRQWGCEVGLDRWFTIYDVDDAKKTMKQALLNVKLYEETVDRKELSNWCSRISGLKNAGSQIGDVAYPSVKDWEMDDTRKAWKEYQRLLSSQNAVDFDDLLTFTLELLRTSDSARSYYQRGLKHVCVDEFQDTNLVQAGIVELLAPPHLVASNGMKTSHPTVDTNRTQTDADNVSGDGSDSAGLSMSRSLFLVGDMDQSIYAFRGARPELLNQVKTTYGNVTVLYLPINYRSTKTIVDLSKQVISGNRSDLRADLRTENPQGEKARIHTFEDSYREAEWLARDIQRRNLNPNDVAVIYRTNYQSRGFEFELKRAGLPHRIIGGVRFYDRAEVKDLVAFLRLVNNPNDVAAFLRCANIPRRAMSAAACVEVVEYADSHETTVVDALEALAGDGKNRRRKAFKNLHDFLAELSLLSPADALQHVLDAGYNAMIAKMEKPLERAENVRELVGHVRTFDGKEGLADFLAETTLLTSDDDAAEETGVTLMTAHASKGKEFPHVYVVAVQDGSFPHAFSKAEPDGISEERRLLFVAVSRAEETVSLSAHRESRGGWIMPSPFTTGLFDELVTYDSPRSRAWFRDEY